MFILLVDFWLESYENFNLSLKLGIFTVIIYKCKSFLLEIKLGVYSGGDFRQMSYIGRFIF